MPSSGDFHPSPRVTSTTMTAGDILLFYEPRGRISLVTLLTRSSCYHVAICVDAKYIIEAMPRGVIRTDIATKRGERFLIIPPPSESAADSAVKWAIKHIGDGYDPKDLVSLALDRVFAHLRINYISGGRFTCSEFVATAYEKAGKPLFSDIAPQKAVPSDFARLLPESARKTIRVPKG